jgi:hypothetical protein
MVATKRRQGKQRYVGFYGCAAKGGTVVRCRTQVPSKANAP